jgi:hypothetical protein
MYYNLKDKHVKALVAARKLIAQSEKLEAHLRKNEKKMSESAFEKMIERSETLDERAQVMVAKVMRELVKL